MLSDLFKRALIEHSPTASNRLYGTRGYRNSHLVESTLRRNNAIRFGQEHYLRPRCNISLPRPRVRLAASAIRVIENDVDGSNRLVHCGKALLGLVAVGGDVDDSCWTVAVRVDQFVHALCASQKRLEIVERVSIGIVPAVPLTTNSNVHAYKRIVLTETKQ